ncbi:MAG: signal peptidase I [Clostridiales Family XIII bacterium]|jgi:signal peptidase I|nr:signal peptidase I [Clostridiales Family XIII bacterium]
MEPEIKPKNRIISRGVLIWARDVAIALLIAIIIMQFIKPTIVREHSMLNTLYPNDYIFLSKQAYTFGEVKHGDVVVFHSQLTDEKGVKKNLIKRVIGLPGDTVAIHDGSVYLNGKALDEPYTKDGRTDGVMSEVTVPAGELFLMGDNRQQSTDSRSSDVGFVPKKNLIGKAVFKLFPFNDMRVIK